MLIDFLNILRCHAHDLRFSARTPLVELSRSLRGRAPQFEKRCSKESDIEFLVHYKTINRLSLDAIFHKTCHRVIKHPGGLMDKVLIAKFAPIVGPGHQHSLVDAVIFPSYSRHARLERDLTIWLAKEGFDKL
ncbi:hypothetical protein TNCV_2960201 [Trichonephila clavipes]|nr:hypothetical protein TNCV_2960201 [Trichonephila clavipes]